MPQAMPVLKLAGMTFTDVDASAEIGNVARGGFADPIARDSANNQNAYWGGVVSTSNGYAARIRLLLNGTFPASAGRAPEGVEGAGETSCHAITDRPRGPVERLARRWLPSQRPGYGPRPKCGRPTGPSRTPRRPMPRVPRLPSSQCQRRARN